MPDDAGDGRAVHGDAHQTRHGFAVTGGEFVGAVEGIDEDDDARGVDGFAEMRRPIERGSERETRLRRARDHLALGREGRHGVRFRGVVGGGWVVGRGVLVRLLGDDGERGAEGAERAEDVCLDAPVGFGLRVDDVLAGDVVTSALIARAEVASRDDVADDALALDVQIQEERDELRDAHARGGGVGEGARAKARGGVVGDVVSPDVVREGRGRARGEDAARSARERRGGARTAGAERANARGEARARRNASRRELHRPEGRARRAEHPTNARGRGVGNLERVRRGSPELVVPVAPRGRVSDCCCGRARDESILPSVGIRRSISHRSWFEVR